MDKRMGTSVGASWTVVCGDSESEFNLSADQYILPQFDVLALATRLVQTGGDQNHSSSFSQGIRFEFGPKFRMSVSLGAHSVTRARRTRLVPRGRSTVIRQVTDRIASLVEPAG